MTSDWIRPAQSRRGFLRIGAGAVAAGALQPIARAQDATFRRWEITDPGMPPGVLDSYKKGIREMLKLPATDPRNWYRQAFVHIFDCPHGNWWFLAWHRAYLGWMEQTLRDLSGDAQFALPYWDWTKAPRIPAAMFDDVLDPNNATFIASFNDFRSQFNTPVTALWGKWSREQKAALARRGLNTPADFWNEAQQMFFDRPGARGLTAASPDLDSVTQVAVRIATVRAALQTTIFAGTGTGGAGFASAKAANHSVGSNKGILESQPHDNVHGAIGGPSGNAFMVSFLSPVDPIFFLHHGNLDRLWDVWNRRQTALKRRVLPQGADLTAWSGEKFLFFSDARGQSVSKINAGDYATIGAFGYDYSPGSGEDQVPPPASLVAALPPPRVFSAQITARSTGGGAAAGGVAQVPAAALQAGTAEASPQVAEVTLNLSPADQGRRFRVLVSTGGGATPIEAGGITVFSPHDHGPITFTVPLPGEVRARAAGRANVPLDIRVVPLEHVAARPAAGGPSVAPPLSLRAARLNAAPRFRSPPSRSGQTDETMRRHVPMALLAAGLVGPWAGMVVAAETATVDLAAPPAMAHGTALELQVTAGPLPRGARLVLMTGAGEVLGAVTPFPVGSRSSRATVPVPDSAIIGGRLRLRLQVAGPGMPPRPPEPGEVQRLDLRGMPREE